MCPGAVYGQRRVLGLSLWRLLLFSPVKFSCIISFICSLLYLGTAVGQRMEFLESSFSFLIFSFSFLE